MSNELKNALIELNKATQQIIQTFAELERSDNIVEVCQAFKELSEQLSNLEIYQKELNLIYDKFSGTIIPDLFESNKIDSIKLSGRNFILSTRPFFSIPQDKEEKGFAYLKEIGLESLIKPKVNGNSLSSAISEIMREKGIMPPEDCVSVHIKKYISMRKA